MTADIHDTLDKAYDPKPLEQALYDAWERAGYFAPRGDGAPYCIMLPPPNVTGSLHMGHAFQHTLMDALVRLHRMQGERSLWQAGTDHAGIATQMVVERQLEAEGGSRRALGRTAFLERVWGWKAQSGGRITEQMRRLGASADWSRERFTLDEGLSRAVTEVFVRLYDEGLIYRGKRLVNWDPVLHTAVSDLEVTNEEERGTLWHLRYPIVGSEEHLAVATTRPETLLGDAAVAVHPDDPRYRHLIGKHAALPLTGRTIPVIADTYVDREFGSGCVKITPAHDFNDYEVSRRHGLPLINVFTPDARIDLPGSAYHGLDRFEARRRVVADLERDGLLEKAAPHALMVPRGDRSGAVLEPYLTDQWYVRVAPLAEQAIKAVEDGRIRFIPDNYAKIYFDWMHKIQDWCISRQIWWGHRIPAWYDPEGRTYVARSEAEARTRHGLGDGVALTQDGDVLDTWFSSALWPFSTLGWPDATPELKTFYPTNVLVTGFDIIFFWVARMIMMGLKFAGDVPFREVYITGLVRDADGHKMSKSKGNILDPLDLIDGIDIDALVTKRTTGLMQPQMAKRIEQATRKQFPRGIPAFGTDALRFTLASLATQGRNVNFDLGRMEGYRNFCNKLWNASRYVFMNTEGRDTGLAGERALGLPERWIASRLQQVIGAVRAAFAEYRFDVAAGALYHFIWDDYCSWYLEASKTVLTDPNATAHAQRGTRHTLVTVLEALARLLHPIAPFITEAIWRRAAPLAGVRGDTVMLQPYPTARTETIDADAIAEMQWVMGVVTGVRNIRGESDIAPAKPLPALLAGGGTRERAYYERNAALVAALARLSALTWLDGDQAPPQSATAVAGGMSVLVPLAGLIEDKGAELKRLGKKMEKLEKDLLRSQHKLSNPEFARNAPPEVVEQEHRRIAEFEALLSQLKTQRARVESLPG